MTFDTSMHEYWHVVGPSLRKEELPKGDALEKAVFRVARKDRAVAPTKVPGVESAQDDPTTSQPRVEMHPTSLFDIPMSLSAQVEPIVPLRPFHPWQLSPAIRSRLTNRSRTRVHTHNTPAAMAKQITSTSSGAGTTAAGMRMRTTPRSARDPCRFLARLAKRGR